MTSPTVTLIPKSNPNIVKTSILSFPVRTRTNRPRPPLAQSPAIADPYVSVPLRNSSVIATEAAQLGMSPMKAAIKG